VEELFSLFQFLRAKPLDDWNNFKVQIVQPVKQGKVKFAMKKIHVSEFGNPSLRNLLT